MKNRCLKREDLFALAQGMIGEHEASKAMGHVASCAGCRGVFESYRRLDAVLDDWKPEVEPSPWFDARVRAAASQRQVRAARGFFGLDLNRWLALPVLASLMVVAGVVTFRRPAPVIVKPVAVRAVAPVSAPPAQAVNRSPAAPQSGAQEIKMYQNLSVLEDYDMLAGFDVISELPQRTKKIAD